MISAEIVIVYIYEMHLKKIKKLDLTLTKMKLLSLIRPNNNRHET